MLVEQKRLRKESDERVDQMVRLRGWGGQGGVG